MVTGKKIGIGVNIEGIDEAREDLNDLEEGFGNAREEAKSMEQDVSENAEAIGEVGEEVEDTNESLDDLNETIGDTQGRFGNLKEKGEDTFEKIKKKIPGNGGGGMLGLGIAALGGGLLVKGAQTVVDKFGNIIESGKGFGRDIIDLGKDVIDAGDDIVEKAKSLGQTAKDFVSNLPGVGQDQGQGQGIPAQVGEFISENKKEIIGGGGGLLGLGLAEKFFNISGKGKGFLKRGIAGGRNILGGAKQTISGFGARAGTMASSALGIVPAIGERSGALDFLKDISGREFGNRNVSTSGQQFAMMPNLAMQSGLGRTIKNTKKNQKKNVTIHTVNVQNNTTANSENMNDGDFLDWAEDVGNEIGDIIESV